MIADSIEDEHNIINRKSIIKWEVKETERQSGFRKDRCCVEKLIQPEAENRKEIGTRQAVHVAFIGLWKAFDIIRLQKLWAS